MQLQKTPEEEKIERFCRKLKLEPHFANNLLFITTPFSKWYIEMDKTPIKLCHANSNPYRKGKMGFKHQYHVQEKTFENCYDALKYIKKHDYNKLKRDAKRARQNDIFRQLTTT